MYQHQIRSLGVSRIAAVAVLAMLLGVFASRNLAEDRSGAVYTISNQSTGNSVIVFHRAHDGALSFAGSFPTGGTGAGTGADPLASQGAVVLDRSNRLLFAVNAGSNQVSVFAVDHDRLHLLDTINSHGTRPISIAVHGNLVYVLNAGGTPNIAGFTLDTKNRLVFLAGSERGLAGGTAANPAQISFSVDGDVLMVTEKGTQSIDTYTLTNDGYASGPISNLSSGSTPFGFEFTHRNVAVVSEAGPNALSSYRTNDNGQLELITASLPNGQQAVCWVVVTNDGRFAYSVNSATRTISSYAVSPEGILTLLDPVAASTGPGSAPTDAALAPDRLLYIRDGGQNAVHGFRVEADGSLTPIGTAGGVPAGSQGLATR